jgi:hypothetical protein
MVFAAVWANIKMLLDSVSQYLLLNTLLGCISQVHQDLKAFITIQRNINNIISGADQDLPQRTVLGCHNVHPSER